MLSLLLAIIQIVAVYAGCNKTKNENCMKIKIEQSYNQA